MLSSSMSKVPTTTNLRRGAILFSAYHLTVVDPFPDQALAALTFSIMCRGSMGGGGRNFHPFPGSCH